MEMASSNSHEHRQPNISSVEDELHTMVAVELEFLKSRLLPIVDQAVRRGAAAAAALEQTERQLLHATGLDGSGQAPWSQLQATPAPPEPPQEFNIDVGIQELFLPDDDGNNDKPCRVQDVETLEFQTRPKVTINSEATCTTQDVVETSEFQALPGMAVKSTMTTPQKLLILREEWVLDRSRTRHIIEAAEESQPLGGVYQLICTEEKRVITEVLDYAIQHEVDRSSVGHTAKSNLQSLLSFDTEPHSEESRMNYFHIELPLSPHSTGRLAWDVSGLLLVVYDAVALPLVLMVLQQSSSFGVIMPVVANIFWTVDIALSFLTATVKDDMLTTSLAEVAQQYAKSWLLLDLILVMPEWICMLLNGRRAGFALLRILKSFRAIRLLRLVKMESLLQKQLKRSNSDAFLHSIRLLQVIFAFLMLNHWMACSWYLIGRSTGDGWLEEQVVAKSKGTLDAYLLALHWSITQFHGSTEVMPGNLPERLFAVVMLILGMLLFSVFVSFMTDMIFQVRQAHKKNNAQHVRLRNYFRRHTVSAQLMLSVKAHVQLHMDMAKNCQDDNELLQALPEQLGRSLLLEVRQPTIYSHWLFTWMRNKYCTSFRDICYSAFVAMPAIMGHTVFASTDACAQMYFVESGTLRYLAVRGDSPLQRQGTLRTSVGPDSKLVKRLARFNIGTVVPKRRWVCEPALWIQAWQTHGELIAVANSILLVLESSRFAQVISRYPALHFDVTVYARWVAQDLKNCELKDLLDLWVPSIDKTSDFGGGPSMQSSEGEVLESTEQ